MRRRRKVAVEACLALNLAALLRHAEAHGAPVPSPLEFVRLSRRLKRYLTPRVGTTVRGAYEIQVRSSHHRRFDQTRGQGETAECGARLLRRGARARRGSGPGPGQSRSSRS
jgi:hypothetical protein